MQHFQATGFSEEVFRLSAAPKRPSTNHMYDNRWLLSCSPLRDPQPRLQVMPSLGCQLYKQGRDGAR